MPPPFSLSADKFDQSTYMGRFWRFLDIVDPRMAFVSDEELDSSRRLLAEYKAGNAPAGTTDEELWHARKVVEAIIHPDLDEKVPAPFRMSNFVFMNVPVSAGMLMAPATPFNTLFFQWLNQSYNAGMNYCNRNATVPTDMKSLAVSYVAATSVAGGTAMGLNTLLARATGLTAGARAALQRVVPFTAVACAGAFNVLAMRYREGIEGVKVTDAEGAVRGTSVTAGRTSLMQVATTRVVLPIPILFLPPLIMAGLQAIPGLGAMIKAKKWVRIPLELSLVSMGLLLGLPAAIATFPQIGALPVQQMEPQFHHLTLSDGTPVTELYYNKGM
jgi:tricarboxylate carrier